MNNRKRPFKPRKGPDSPRSQVAQIVREMVSSGAILPGESPPSERLLSKQQNMHRDTVHRAFLQLEEEGLLQKVSRGWIVCRDTPSGSSLSILKNTAMIVTPGELVYNPYHKVGGWSDNIAFGAIEELRGGNNDAFLISRQRFLDTPLEQIAASGISGIIVTDIDTDVLRLHPALRRCIKAGVPVVAYGNNPQLPEVNRVYSDHTAGALLIMQWLAAKGCRKVLTLSPFKDFYWVMDRAEGYRIGVEKYNMEWQEPITFPRFMPDGGAAENIDRHLDMESRHFLGYLADRLMPSGGIDAIMADSDGQLFAIARACRLLGIDPQKDILLCGYDNYWRECPEQDIFPFAPALTVDKMNDEIGRSMVQMLMEICADGIGAEARVKKLTPKLVVTGEE